jgi:hypothetical protein
MKRLPIAIAIAFALLSASVASAKGSLQTLVCGRSPDPPTSRACLIIAKDKTVRALLVQSEGSVRRSPPRPAPFYTVTFLFPGGRPWRSAYLYVPSRGMIRVASGGSISWRSASTTVTTAFHRLSKRIRPFVAPRHWR